MSSGVQYIPYTVLITLITWGVMSLAHADLTASFENFGKPGAYKDLDVQKVNLTRWLRFLIDMSIIGLTIAFLVVYYVPINPGANQYYPYNLTWLFGTLIILLCAYFFLFVSRTKAFYYQGHGLANLRTGAEIVYPVATPVQDELKTAANDIVAAVEKVPPVKFQMTIGWQDWMKNSVNFVKFNHVFQFVCFVSLLLFQVASLWIYGGIYGYNAAGDVYYRYIDYPGKNISIILTVFCATVIGFCALISRFYTWRDVESTNKIAKQILEVSAVMIPKPEGVSFDEAPKIAAALKQTVNQDLPRFPASGTRTVVQHTSQAYLPLKIATAMALAPTQEILQKGITPENLRIRGLRSQDGKTVTYYMLNKDNCAALDRLMESRIGNTFDETRLTVGNKLMHITNPDIAAKLRFGASESFKVEERGKIGEDESATLESKPFMDAKTRDNEYILSGVNPYPQNPAIFGEYPINFGLQHYFHQVMGCWLGIGTLLYIPHFIVFCYLMYRLPFLTLQLRSNLYGPMWWMINDLSPYLLSLIGQMYGWWEIYVGWSLVSNMSMYMARYTAGLVDSYPTNNATFDVNTTVLFGHSTYTTPDNSTSIMAEVSVATSLNIILFIYTMYQLFWGVTRNGHGLQKWTFRGIRNAYTKDLYGQDVSREANLLKNENYQRASSNGQFAEVPIQVASNMSYGSGLGSNSLGSGSNIRRRA